MTRTFVVEFVPNDSRQRRVIACVQDERLAIKMALNDLRTQGLLEGPDPDAETIATFDLLFNYEINEKEET